jgi:hypothetical protein
MPEAYYLAAYYLSLDGREQEAREYASLFLEKAGKYEQADAKLDWAERLVSGSSVPDEAPSPAAETAKIFIDESAGADWDPKGEPTVPLVLFAEERSFEPPWGERSLKNDLRQLWAYFEFDNAAGVRAVSWDWSQNGITTSDYGIQLWPGSNKGQAWILLQNTLQGVNSRGSLKIVFDGEQVASADIYLRDDAFVSPATFYGDAAATEPVLFYKGRPNPVYVALNYVSVLPGSGLVWVAERDGARVGEGNLVLKEEAGKAIIPIDLSPDLETGLIRIHFYLDGELTRTASLALAPAQVAERPPFERFDIGMSPDGEGILAQVTKEFPPDAWQIDYVVDGIDLAPESELTIRWYREGEPLGLFEDSYTGQDGVRKAISFVAENPESGEYQVLVSLDGELVYADVVVVG